VLKIDENVGLLNSLERLMSTFIMLFILRGTRRQDFYLYSVSLTVCIFCLFILWYHCHFFDFASVWKR